MTDPLTPRDHHSTRPTLRLLGTPLIVACIAVATLIAAVLEGGAWGRRAALSELRDSATAALHIYSAALRSEFERRRAVPMVLAQDPDILRLLRNPHDSAKVGQANRKLAEIAGALAAAAIYIMDRDGMTLAASNWESEESFVGHNFSFRPYFQKALRDGEGEFFALGSVSQKPGFYVSHAISASPSAAVIGVIVLKIQFDELEARWRESMVHVLVTDENGVVLLADDPAWRFRTLEHLPKQTLAALRKSRQFGGMELMPIGFTSRPSPDGSTLLDAYPSADEPQPRTYLRVVTAVPGTPWHLHTLTPLGNRINREAASASLLAGLIGLGVITGILLLWLRQNQMRSRVLEQRRIREELEHRVQQRTADLTASYDRLQNEIAERERVEAHLGQAQEKLVHAEKLAALGQMAAGISHEVNQPLAAIRSYSDNALVLYDRGRTGEVRANLSAVAALTEKIGQIMQHLRVFARKASGKIEPVSMNAAIAGSVALMAHRFRREKIRFVLKAPKAEVWVWGEQVRIEQVLLNLLQNAADALQGCLHPKICLSVRHAHEHVCVTVKDHGCGIAPQHMPSLFSAFFTTKDGGKGLGLGLYISRGIVEEFGGTLLAASDPVTGTTFTLTLRAADDATCTQQSPMAVESTETLMSSPQIPSLTQHERAA